MNGDPRDPLDDAIAEDLGAFAPDDIDADAALGAMRPALQRARSRHRMAVTSGALGAIVIVLGVGGLLVGRHDGHVNVQGHATTLPEASTSTPKRRASTTTTHPKLVTSTTQREGEHRGGTSTTIPGSSGSRTTVPEHHGGGPGPSDTGANTTSPTKPTPAPFTQTYASTGGTATITFANGMLTLDSDKPSPGYQVDVNKNSSDDIDIRFTSGGHTSRIRDRIRDGAPSEETSESG